jgi:phospholipase/carboxylesterase
VTNPLPCEGRGPAPPFPCEGRGPVRKKTPAKAVLLFLALLFGAAPAPTQPLVTHALVTHSRVFALPDEAVGYIPATAPAHPPLLVLLHGAGRERLLMVQHFEAEADKRGIVLLAPTSRGPTWDSVESAEAPLSEDSPLANRQSHRFTDSPDARRVEAAIANLGKIVPVDRARTVLAGFSDGATFALAMGMARAHPFAAVIAWSPGIAIATADPARGRRVFVSHGRTDPILKFQTTCNDIVPLLQSEGAAVTWLPFEGGHDAPVWLKDTFLDAVFGRVAGSEGRALPTEVERCAGAKAEVPRLPGP